MDKFLIYTTVLSRHFNKTTSFRVHKKTIFPRPYVCEFIEICCQKFDVGLWAKTDMSELLDQMDPIVTDGTLADGGLKFIECYEVDMKVILKAYPNDYIKENIIFLDCSPAHDSLNPYYSKLYPKPYYGDCGDTFLKLSLLPFLLNLVDSTDTAHHFIRENYPIWSEESRLRDWESSKRNN